ncbi:hypothetical protein EYF80_053322 [Liparis tanakae]|uniref:Uncharacterized protein n=1 Tax=Liparis tanakae TaxID=230148 RepID=A0A4Z2F873_9TELE|nr:hypothetical protein EYF80_053322 [Liparis tanakae]
MGRSPVHNLVTPSPQLVTGPRGLGASGPRGLMSRPVRLLPARQQTLDLLGVVRRGSRGAACGRRVGAGPPAPRVDDLPRAPALTSIVSPRPVRH